MNREDIIRMAREAGLPLAWISEYAVRLAALVAAREREACARIVSSYGDPPEPIMVGTYEAGWHNAAEAIAAAIRARGET